MLIQLVLIQPAADARTDLPDAAGVIGYLKTGAFHQLRKGSRTGLIHKGQVLLPGLGIVFPGKVPELERHRLRHAVIDVVQRDFIDVKLTLPAAAAGIERQVIKVDPRAEIGRASCRERV